MNRKSKEPIGIRPVLSDCFDYLRLTIRSLLDQVRFSLPDDDDFTAYLLGN